MTVITLVPKKRGKYSGNSIWFDKTTEDTALVVDNAAFDSAQDLIYDVKGLDQAFVQFLNSGANSIDMLIEKSTKEFTDLTTLVDADFVQEVAVAAIVASALSVAFTKTDISPEITALRFRFRETVGASPGAAKFAGGFQ